MQVLINKDACIVEHNNEVIAKKAVFGNRAPHGQDLQALLTARELNFITVYLHVGALGLAHEAQQHYSWMEWQPPAAGQTRMLALTCQPLQPLQRQLLDLSCAEATAAGQLNPFITARLRERKL